MTSIDNTLAERQKTHGDFTDNAQVMQQLKNVARSRPQWDRLTLVQREALEMILHKVGRILSGNPNEPDHWHDIAGYATLARDRCVRAPGLGSAWEQAAQEVMARVDKTTDGNRVITIHPDGRVEDTGNSMMTTRCDAAAQSNLQTNAGGLRNAYKEKPDG